MDGLYPYTVYKGNREKLRALAVHPVKSLLFVTDWNFPGSIVKMRLDGSNSVKILNQIGWPNGVTIDYDVSKIWELF